MPPESSNGTRGHAPGPRLLPRLAAWIANTSVYVRQSKSDIHDLLARRPGIILIMSPVLTTLNTRVREQYLSVASFLTFPASTIRNLPGAVDCFTAGA